MIQLHFIHFYTSEGSGERAPVGTDATLQPEGARRVADVRAPACQVGSMVDGLSDHTVNFCNRKHADNVAEEAQIGKTQLVGISSLITFP
jgi:hypothetical protein